MAAAGPDYRFPEPRRKPGNSRRKARGTAIAGLALLLVLGGTAAILLRKPDSPLSGVMRSLPTKSVAKLVRWKVGRRGRTLDMTCYYIRGCRRIVHADGEVELLTPSAAADYRPDLKCIYLSRFGDNADGRSLQNLVPGFVGAMPGAPEPEWSRSGVVDGVKGKTYTVTQRRGQQLIVYTIDAATDLPLTVVEMAWNDADPRHRWYARSVLEIEYPSNLPETLFDPGQLPNVRHIDVDHPGSAFAAEFGHRLATVTLQGRELTLLDAQVNASGDLYLAFEGDMPPEWTLLPPFGSLTDDMGIDYAHSNSFGRETEIKIETGSVHVSKWVPTQYPQKFKPRRFTLRLLDSDSPRPPLLQKVITFTVASPGPQLAPLYATGPKTTKTAEERDDCVAAAHYLEALCNTERSLQKVHFGAEVPRALSRDAHDRLEQALSLNQRAARSIRDDENMDPRTRGGQLAEIYDDLTLDIDTLGRHEEAARLRNQYLNADRMP